MMSCTRLYVELHRGDGPRKEMEASWQSKKGMRDHEGTGFFS